MRDPLKPHLYPTEACPGKLIPGNESQIANKFSQVICVRIHLAQIADEIASLVSSRNHPGRAAHSWAGITCGISVTGRTMDRT